MYIIDDIAIIFSAYLAISGTIFLVGDNVRRRKLDQKYWEKGFLEEYRELVEKHLDTNDYIKLSIQDRKDENLLSLCRQYYSVSITNLDISKLFEKFDPKIETVNYIGFRRIKDPSKPKPIRAEIVRCNKTYGLIRRNEDKKDSTYNVTYLLKKARKQDDSVNGEIFFIHGKFYSWKEIPHSETDQKKFEQEFLTRNRDYLERNEASLQNLTMPSNFDAEEITRFMGLCIEFKSSWSFSRKTEPSLKPLYLDFRRVDSNPGPVRIEMIKCAGNYAIMLAEKNSAIYLLTKGKYVKNLKTKVFNIFSRIPYTHETQNPPADLPVNNQSASNTSEKSCSD